MTNHFDKMTSWKRARAASEESGELAEGVGFEPTVGFPTLDFESSALNRTQPPFPSLDIVDRIFGCAIFGSAVCLQRRSRTRALNGAMDVTLTDGGIETRIIYEFKRPIGNFEAYQLLADEAGRDILRRVYG